MLVKYPRTPHLAGSRLQPGDEDLDQVPFARLRGRHLVIEEKVDGANAGISFTADGELRVQSRGHYLTGGPRERQFAALKSWATVLAGRLWPRIGDRYIIFGEWLYAKHTVFYDALPHYFAEFDILDRATGHFLDTPSRNALLHGLPITSVPVLRTGTIATLAELTALAGPSRWRTPSWRDALTRAAATAGVDPHRAAAETDRDERMEGLYIKDETGGHVTARYKWVRATFATAIADSGSHWADRPVIANRLTDPEALYAGI